MSRIKRFLSGAFLFFAGTLTTRAHVEYVITQETIAHEQGSDFAFLLSPLSDPGYLFLIIATAGAFFLFVRFVERVPAVRSALERMTERMRGYGVYLGWILRLSLGIALIGAGSSGVLVSPAALSASSALSFAQLLAGFSMLAGFLLPVAAFATLGLFLAALSGDWSLFGNLDFFALSSAVLMLGSREPGVDHIFNLPFLSPLTRWRVFAPVVVRLGTGAAFLFLAIWEKFLNPHMSAAVVELYGLVHIIPVSPAMWVLSAGLIEAAVGFFILIGYRVRLFSAIAFAVVATTFFYFGEDVYAHVTLFGSLSFLFVTQGAKLPADSIHAS
jgi:uncharacterized membrane protein YphA (DoxX/SURF4 family)